VSIIPRNHTLTNRLLWTAQISLAVLFAFAGTMKFVMPAAEMQSPIALPLSFIYFIGICECLGALGLVLPGVTHIQTRLTPLAAAGLTIIMIGATIVTVIGMGALPALFPLCVGAVATWVAYARARVLPLTATRRAQLRAAHS
jgi:uncharacterized membrane protein YphA (DoxX/SURF4 family)